MFYLYRVLDLDTGLYLSNKDSLNKCTKQGEVYYTEGAAKGKKTRVENFYKNKVKRVINLKIEVVECTPKP